MICGCSNKSSSNNPQTPIPTYNSIQTSLHIVQTTGTTVPSTIASPTAEKIATMKKIVENYHATHTYSLPDLYVCGDMSSDVWDMLKTQGITAKIEVGNIDKDISKIEDANHAWVLAEAAPDYWIALETTGGYLVCSDVNYCATSNPLYYKGWSFASPREYKDAIEKMKHPCGEGYVLGNDDLCHLACGGSSYCTGNSVCINGQCKGCDPGYILGEDMKCHLPCGSGKSYCTGDNVCVNGQCMGCDPGYILGEDMKCHQPCGSTTTYCSGNSVCMNGKCFSK